MNLRSVFSAGALLLLSCSFIPGSSYSWNPLLKSVDGKVELLMDQGLGLGKKIMGEGFPNASSKQISISNITELSPFIDHETHFSNRNGFYSWADYVFEETDSSGSSFHPWPHYSFVNIALLKEKTEVSPAKSPNYSGRPEFMNPGSTTEINYTVNLAGDLQSDKGPDFFRVFQVTAEIDVLGNPFSGFLPSCRYLMATFLKKNYYIEIAVFDDFNYPESRSADSAYAQSGGPAYLQSPAWKKIKAAMVKLGVE